MPHRIRLRGPWEYEPLERLAPAENEFTPLPLAGTVTLPADWGATLGADFRGRVRYLRRFGRPTNLTAHERVWLVCDGADLRASVTLNGTELGPIDGPAAAARFDVTLLLTERNQLLIEVELPPLAAAAEQQLRGPRAGLPGGLIGEVRLEIEETN